MHQYCNFRFPLDGSVSPIYVILHVGMVQPAQNTTHVPRQLYHFHRILLPDGHFDEFILGIIRIQSSTVTLSMSHLDRMIASNAPFARKFRANDPVLDVIDSHYLGRNHSNGFTYGWWCTGFPPRSRVGNTSQLLLCRGGQETAQSHGSRP